MKKLFLVASSIVLFSFLTADNTISKKERNYAIKLLKDTEKAVFDQVKGLTPVQLTFKPAPDRWSIEECVKHIAASEEMFGQLTEGTIKQPANPEKKSEIKFTDEQLVQKIEDRTNKVKTSEKLEPENVPLKSTEEALDSFKMNRDKLIDYVKGTNEDLRAHIATLSFGSVDSYQLFLFVAAHSNRHTQQIMEVKADPNFPK